MAGPLQLSQISLRRGERGGALVLGGSNSGKSTLADLLGQEYVLRYRHLGASRLILDSKPRFRAEWEMTGLSAARRYRHWDHGAVVRDSVLLQDPHDLERALRMHSNVIIQGESGADLGRLLAAAEAYLRRSRAGRPQLLQVDETLDFFHTNGAARGGTDVILRASRAGGERGTLPLYCSQRTKGMPPQLIEELKRCYLFLMDFEADVARLVEAGAPRDTRPPQEERQFLFWTKRDRRRWYGPYRLRLPA